MRTLFLLAIVCSGLHAQTQSVNGVPNQTLGSIGSSALSSTSGFGLFPIQVCHAQYSFATDGGGAPGLITPANNCTFPAKSILIGSIVNWTTAGVGVLNTTSIGVTGTGGSAIAVMPATAVASLTGFVTGAVTFATPIKITTSGTVTVTTNTAALSAGVCEIFILFVVSPT